MLSLFFFVAKVSTESLHAIILLITEYRVVTEAPSMVWFPCISGDVCQEQ